MTSTSEKKRCLVVGLDGVSFNILNPLIKEGQLPNISRMINSGVSGNLISTYPPLSCSAWASFITGKNPGKHGIFSWSRRKENSYELKQINSAYIKEPAIWDVLTTNGIKSIIINIPIIYPPQEINGVMISGMLSPRNDSSIIYPSSLYNELLSNIGEYVLDVEWQNYSRLEIDSFLKDIEYCTTKRAETAFYLMDRCEWDLFTIVFVETDRLQHFLMDYIIDDPHSGIDSETRKKFRDKIFPYYRRLDDIIGKFVKKVGENTNIFLVSDHGFSVVEKSFYLNHWLSLEGYLSRHHTGLKFKTTNRIKSLLKSFGIERQWIQKKISFIGRQKKLVKARLDQFSSINQIVDWEKTQAYSIYADGININLRGREPLGIVNPGSEYETLRDELACRMKEIKDPENGKRVIADVFRREDIYKGENLHLAPDLIIKRNNKAAILFMHNNFETNSLYKKESKRSGYHAMEGIFIASGPDVKNDFEFSETPELIDIAPTILYSLNVPILEDFDGKVLKQIFKDSFTKIQPLQYQTIDKKEQTEASLHSDDERTVLERLKGLGYM